MYRARSNLNLRFRTRRNQLFPFDPPGKVFMVHEDSIDTQDVRHQVVSENRQLIEVVKFSPALIAKSKGKIGGHQLRALVEGNSPGTPRFYIFKERHCRQLLDKSLRASMNAFDQRRVAASIAVQEQTAQVV